MGKIVVKVSVCLAILKLKVLFQLDPDCPDGIEVGVSHGDCICRVGVLAPPKCRHEGGSSEYLEGR